MPRREVGETSGATLVIKEPGQKAPPYSHKTLNTSLPQQSSPSSREEECHWVAMEGEC